MGTIRRALGGMFIVLGAYYCVISVRTLVRLPRVTERWIHLSGDPDFKLDEGIFVMWIGVGAVFVGILGFRTALKGASAVRGICDSWLWVALAALPLHCFWFLYRTIAGGLMDHEGQAMARQDNAIRFGIICLAYLVMWMIMRQRHLAGRPVSHHLQPTA
jgi:hypothetical protein